MNFYLNKYGFLPPSILEKPQEDLSLVVVIPCFNEPDLISTLQALWDNESTTGSVEVIIVINAGAHHPEEIHHANNHTKSEAESWIQDHTDPKRRFLLLHHPDLPKKHAGVGLARKIGMDEAVNRFHELDRDGVIVCFDADATCTPNYLKTIEHHFREHPKTPGCAIHYEHPLSGAVFSEAVYQGIIHYELHLRYYKTALKYAGLPYAYHTVGSSMAVRSSAYQKQGGMNKRKAGEDFYFIHKIIALGHFTEIWDTMVIPSPRVSDRVPFGTGRAIGEWIEQKEDVYSTYHFGIFPIICSLAAQWEVFYSHSLIEVSWDELSEKARKTLSDFLRENKFEAALAEMQKNSASLPTFKKRFFGWLDAFRVLKLVHYFRDHGWENQPLFDQVTELFTQLNVTEHFENEKDQLLFLREFEKK